MRMPFAAKIRRMFSRYRMPFGMAHVDVDLLGRERRPEDPSRAIRERHGRERQAGPGAVDGEQVLLRGAVREYAVERQEHARRTRLPAPLAEKSRNCGERLEMWLTMTSAITSTSPRDRADVLPGAEPLVDFGVIDRVEARIGAIDRMEERQQMHAAEQALQAARAAGHARRAACRRVGRRRR